MTTVSFIEQGGSDSVKDPIQVKRGSNGFNLKDESELNFVRIHVLFISSHLELQKLNAEFARLETSYSTAQDDLFKELCNKVIQPKL